MFRTFQVGGSANGRTSQARDILFSVKSTSPFSDYKDALNPQPLGLTPEEYLEIHVHGASPEQWKELARAFLAEMSNPS
ncbi:hypothetical protein [Ornithinimicrobium cavernae]|uniref:hypothetical protein n=1 Tax=Ornithinimicrobium cavernae TaxID=2666047 RepID=UPI00137B5387|nr:hypothetical protein [Ornithinimicrobium cavernae]